MRLFVTKWCKTTVFEDNWFCRCGIAFYQVELMKETVDRCYEVEESKGGLVIRKALYGKLHAEHDECVALRFWKLFLNLPTHWTLFVGEQPWSWQVKQSYLSISSVYLYVISMPEWFQHTWPCVQASDHWYLVIFIKVFLCIYIVQCNWQPFCNSMTRWRHYVNRIVILCQIKFKLMLIYDIKCRSCNRIDSKIFYEHFWNNDLLDQPSVKLVASLWMQRS